MPAAPVARGELEIPGNMRMAILDAILSDINAPPDQLAMRMFPPVPPGLVEAVRNVFLAVTSQPSWFHRALLKFEGKLSYENPELMAHVRQSSPPSDARYCDPQVLRASLLTWIDLCISPLFAWQRSHSGDSEPPCRVTGPGLYELSPERVRDHLQRMHAHLTTSSSVEQANSAAYYAATRAVVRRMVVDMRPVGIEEAVRLETGIQLTPQQAAGFVSQVKSFLVQPGWLHRQLLAAPRSADQEAFLQRISSMMNNRYTLDHLRVRVTLWRIFCIEPLRAADIHSCDGRTVTKLGKPTEAFVLTPAKTRLALEWLSGLSWLPLE